MTLKLTSAHTDGHACVCEGILSPGCGVPPHAHASEDELFYVLEGECEFDLQPQKLKAAPGAFVYVPSGTFHGFRNVGTGSVKLFNCHAPGGLETFFLDAAEPGPPTGPLDMARALALLKKHGMMLPPAIR